jgi:hypothetical protein
MHYKIEEVVNYVHGGESIRWNNIKIWDCTDEEIKEIRTLIVRLYDEHVQTQVKEEEEWKQQQDDAKKTEFNRELVLPYSLPPN